MNHTLRISFLALAGTLLWLGDGRFENRSLIKAGGLGTSRPAGERTQAGQSAGFRPAVTSAAGLPSALTSRKEVQLAPLVPAAGEPLERTKGQQQ